MIHIHIIAGEAVFWGLFLFSAYVIFLNVLSLCSPSINWLKVWLFSFQELNKSWEILRQYFPNLLNHKNYLWGKSRGSSLKIQFFLLNISIHCLCCYSVLNGKVTTLLTGLTFQNLNQYITDQYLYLKIFNFYNFNNI